MIHIGEIIEVTDDVVAAFARLIPQLSSSYDRYAPSDRDTLRATAAGEHTQLLVARDTGSGEIVGTLTLVLLRLPTGFRARIEDVVVDEQARGVGIGEGLVREAIDRAARAGAGTLRLSSRPTREAANRLYRRMGFEQRETNVYEISVG